MSYIVYGTFESYDAAYFASTRLKESVQGVRILSMESEGSNDGVRTAADAVPQGWPDFPAVNVSGTFTPRASFFSGLDESKGREPSLRSDTILRAEAPDREKADAAVSVLINRGGRKVRAALSSGNGY